MNKFLEVASKVLSCCELIKGKKKLTTDEIIVTYPNGITITGFDFLEGESGQYVVCVYAENSGEYFCGGKALTEMCKEFVKTCGGDINRTNAELVAEGGVKVRLDKIKTNKGRDYVQISIVE